MGFRKSRTDTKSYPQRRWSARVSQETMAHPGHLYVGK